jgi:hypothetical protein
MPLPQPIDRFWLIALAIAVCLGTIGPLGTPSDTIAQQGTDCGSFLDKDDSQVAFDAEPTDPFGLDGNNDGEACEQPEGGFGTSALVSCDDLQDYPDIARALYDHSLTKYGSDRYDLASCVEQGSTGVDPPADNRRDEDSQGDDPEVLDGVPPEARDSTVIVRTGALGTGETLEARLVARFAALEAQFAAFEVRAANGFGRFPESDEEAAGGQAATVVVSTSQEPITANQRATAQDDRPIIRAQKVTEGQGERSKERSDKRGRPKGKHRNRR